jgi:hypothetical protein
MKLSEAILLGSTVVKPKAGSLVSPGREGACALGMAAIVRGCTFAPAVRPILAKDRRTLNAEDVWGPWLIKVVMRTCDCPPEYVPRAMRIKDIIAHLFDEHVMRKKDWTLDQLVAWVATWEPGSPIRPEILDVPGAERASSAGQEGYNVQAAEDWESVRRAFEAKHGPRRKHGPMR